jgi:hypothetical protein
MTARERLNDSSGGPSLPIPTSCAGTHRKSAFELRYQPSGHASEDAEQACISLRSRRPRRRNRHPSPRLLPDKPSYVH